MHATGADKLTLLDERHDLLLKRVPAQRNGIVHGDYRPGNLAFLPDGSVGGVFDWELATSGHSHAAGEWAAAVAHGVALAEAARDALR